MTGATSGVRNESFDSSLIGEIYEASYQPSYWPVVVEKILQLTHSKSGFLAIQDMGIQEAGGFHSRGISPQALSDYATYGMLDPAFEVMRDVPVGVAKNILGPECHAKEAAEYYENIRLKYDVSFVGGTKVLIEGDRTVGLGLHRGSGSCPYEPKVLQQLSELTPHLQRALRIHREFIRLRIQNNIMATGMDRLLVGVILFDHLGTPVYTNPLARSILEYHPAISMAGRSIIVKNQADNAKLRQLILGSVQHQDDTACFTGGALGLKHPDTSAPLVLMVKPVEASDLYNMIDGIPVYAAMYLSDTQRTSPIAPEVVVQVFGLTLSEAQIAIGVANGQDIKTIAQNKCISEHTARTQLKSIYKKTGINRQSELVRLLLTSPLAL